MKPIDGLPPGYTPKPKGLRPIEGLPPGYQPKPEVTDYTQVPLEEQYGSLEPTTMERIGRGAMDLVQGAQQMVRGDEYDQQVADEIARYERYAGDGMDWGRVGGQVMAAVPAAIAAKTAGIPAFLAAKGMPAWAIAGLGGAAETGTLAVTQGESRVGNAVLGGLGGAGGYKLMEKAGQWAGKIWNKISRARRNGQQIALEDTVKEALRESGVDWRELNDVTRKALMDDAADLVRSGTEPQDIAEHIARQQTLEAEGLTPTRARITRNSRDFSREENLAKMEGVGDELEDIRQANLDQLGRRMDEVSDEIAAPVSPYQAGKDLQGAIEDTRKYHKGVEGEAYKAAGEAAGGDVYVPRDNLRMQMQDELGMATPEEISKPIVERLQRYVDEEDIFTVEVAENEIKRINKLLRSPRDASQYRSLKVLKQAILDDLDEVGAEGQGAAASWAAARREVYKRRGLAGPKASKKPEIVGKILDKNIRADDIVKAVRNSSVEELDALLKYANSGSADTKRMAHRAIGNVRRAIVDDIMNAVSPMKDMQGPISGSRFQKELKKLGPEKLKMLFPKQAGDLIRLAKAAAIETYVPRRSTINFSNSGVFLGDLASKFLSFAGKGMVPIASPAAQGTSNMIMRKGVKDVTDNVLGKQARQVIPQNVLGAGATGAAFGATEQYRSE